MDKYQFLSDEWVAATRKLRSEFVTPASPGKVPSLKLNLVIENVPFGDGTVNAHLDSSSGTPDIELEHLPKVDATITTDYDTARKLFVDGRISKAMEAMQLGRLKVKGNMFKLLGLGKLGNDPESEKLNKQIKAITA